MNKVEATHPSDGEGAQHISDFHGLNNLTLTIILFHKGRWN